MFTKGHLLHRFQKQNLSYQRDIMRAIGARLSTHSIMMAACVAALVAVAPTKLRSEDDPLQLRGSKENPFLLHNNNLYGIVRIDEVFDIMPKQSLRGIGDRLLIRQPNVGVRTVRLYGPNPEHYHALSDTIVYVVRGELSYKVAGHEAIDVGPGDLLFWSRGISHGNPKVVGIADLLVFDMPPRDPNDTVWMNPVEAAPFLER